MKACTSPDDMASRWKDAMQVSAAVQHLAGWEGVAYAT